MTDPADARVLLEAARAFLDRFVDPAAALVDGFDVAAWCEDAERFLDGAGSELERVRHQLEMAVRERDEACATLGRVLSENVSAEMLRRTVAAGRVGS